MPLKRGVTEDPGPDEIGGERPVAPGPDEALRGGRPVADDTEAHGLRGARPVADEEPGPDDSMRGARPAADDTTAHAFKFRPLTEEPGPDEAGKFRPAIPDEEPSVEGHAPKGPKASQDDDAPGPDGAVRGKGGVADEEPGPEEGLKGKF